MKKWSVVALLIMAQASFANSIFIPMDENQRDHLKAYGLAYYTLKAGQPVDWLLNYRGGSFLIPFHNEALTECKVRGITYELISSAKASLCCFLPCNAEKKLFSVTSATPSTLRFCGIVVSTPLIGCHSPGLFSAK